MAALLHDVIEDTPSTLADIEAASAPMSPSSSTASPSSTRSSSRAARKRRPRVFRKMLLAMVRDLRVILVKLADRTHNMRTHRGDGAGAAARDRARDARHLRADRRAAGPVHPQARARGPRLQGAVSAPLPGARARAEAGARQPEGVPEEDRAAAERGAAQGRHRRRRSIDAREAPLQHLPKMRRKRATLSEIVDVYGFRIVVDTPDTCYRALGVVHSVFKPMPGRFKDYIAIPRVNGYQSLHTTLFGPNGVPIEVQIRTEDMHRVAESRRRRALDVQEPASERDSMQQAARARVALEPRRDAGGRRTPRSSSRASRSTCSPTRSTCSRRRATILRLPRGATAVDFAYAVHTDIGNRCVAAKVDRRLMPLRTVLRNGQTVEIITAQGREPNPVVGELRRRPRRRATRSATISRACAQRGHRARHAAAEPGADAVFAELAEVPRATLEALRRRARHEGPRRAVREVGLGERLAPGRRGACCRSSRAITESHARLRSRSRSRAPKACSSTMRAAASDPRTTRSSASCRAAAAS